MQTNTSTHHEMIFSKPLLPAVLVRRYKRFLADVRFNNQDIVTVYCPNTGSMRTCSEPGSPVYLSESDNAKRKYRFTLEMIQHDECWVGINTGRANEIVAEAILNKVIPELQGIDDIQREVTVSPGSRLDLLLMQGSRKMYIEVKNCTLVEGGVAMFPDAVTARGTKHLLELAELVKKGNEGGIFFLVQRTDAESFMPAAHIDPLYAEVLEDVSRQGVKILAYQAEVTPVSIEIVGRLPHFPGK